LSRTALPAAGRGRRRTGTSSYWKRYRIWLPRSKSFRSRPALTLVGNTAAYSASFVNVVNAFWKSLHQQMSLRCWMHYSYGKCIIHQREKRLLKRMHPYKFTSLSDAMNPIIIKQHVGNVAKIYLLKITTCQVKWFALFILFLSLGRFFETRFPQQSCATDRIS
jgi:hypothetical protein